MRAISLLYHDVVEPGELETSGFSGADANIYKFERPQFERHLEALGRAVPEGAITLMPAALDPAACPVLLTFDDGGASAHAIIARLLEERGWRGHFFVPTDYIGRPAFLTAAQIRDLHQRGHSIGSHSCSHPVRMSHCPPAMLDREWRHSVEVLSNVLGSQVRMASLPGGYYASWVAAAAAAAGIEVLFTSEPVATVSQVDGCMVLGRYSIRPGVTAAAAAAIAQGRSTPRLQQYVFWNAKKPIKRLGGAYWLAWRKAWLARRSDRD